MDANSPTEAPADATDRAGLYNRARFVVRKGLKFDGTDHHNSALGEEGQDPDPEWEAEQKEMAVRLSQTRLLSAEANSRLAENPRSRSRIIGAAREARSSTFNLSAALSVVLPMLAGLAVMLIQRHSLPLTPSHLMQLGRGSRSTDASS